MWDLSPPRLLETSLRPQKRHGYVVGAIESGRVLGDFYFYFYFANPLGGQRVSGTIQVHVGRMSVGFPTNLLVFQP